MLCTCSHILALYPFDQCCCHLCRNIRIFGIIFKVSSAKWGTFNIHCRSKNCADIHCLTFLSEKLSLSADQITVKTGCCRTSCRETDCFFALVDSKMIRSLCLFSNPMRSVCDHNRRNPQSFDTLKMPEICS